MINNNLKSKKVVAIMQPYFLPYIGYWQLINTVDEFIVYDDIEYTKKGWINRNRILANGTAQYITLPLKKDSDYLNIIDRQLAETWKKDKAKTLNKLRNAYLKAPHFESTYNLIEKIITYEEDNLFHFLLNAVSLISKQLSINTPIIISSDLNYDTSLKSQDKVLDICQKVNANIYINAIGGKSLGLYNSEEFQSKNVELQFLKGEISEYQQFDNSFIGGLSIVDLMMFNELDWIKNELNKFEIV